VPHGRFHEKKKTDLTIAMVQARLDREIEKKLKAYSKFFA